MSAAARFAIPADLTARRQWVVWRRSVRVGKETKVPFRSTKPTVGASTTDAGTWSTFEKALEVVERGKADGIGFVFSESDPFCGIDLDGCRDPDTGELNPVAAAIIEELSSYSEVSPSESGIHVIVRGRLHGPRNRRGPVELYDRGRYFAMTGRRLPGFPHSPIPRQNELDRLCLRLFPAPAPINRMKAAISVPEDDRELLDRAFAARNGAAVERLWGGDMSRHRSHSEADLALVAHLAFWTGGDPDRVDRLFRRSGLMREKWERPDYREATLRKALSRG